MKNFLVLILVLFFSKARAQELTLAGNVLLSIKEAGMTVSAPKIQLKDKSRLIHPAGIQLRGSTFIQLSSPEARIITNKLSTGTAYEMAVGVNSKTTVRLTTLKETAAYSIGMESLPTGPNLPFSWSIDPNNAAGENEISISFSWEEEIEPNPFLLKGLVKKTDSEWDMLPISVNGNQAKILNYSEWSDANVFTIKTIYKDSDFDAVPDVQELKEGTDMNHTGDYLDLDHDGVPDYIEMLEQTDPTNSSEFLDSNQDGIPDYIRDRSIITILDNLERTVSWGDKDWADTLGDSILVMTGYGRLQNLPVQWEVLIVDVYSRGKYPVMGNVNLPDGIFNAYEIMPNLSVEVLPKPAPADVQLSNSTFSVTADSSYFKIGQFSVKDELDEIHWLKLLDEGYDNLFFEIIDNTLFWKSDKRAEGKTTFTIIIRVTDRDGNILDKFFEITRLRPSLDDILVNNTFSPNGDGINDTWGVPDLRFFSGVRIQVFERSGKRVFYTENPDERWDGAVIGKPLPVGTYFWTIEISEYEIIRKGMLNILRE